MTYEMFETICEAISEKFNGNDRFGYASVEQDCYGDDYIEAAFYPAPTTDDFADCFQIAVDNGLAIKHDFSPRVIRFEAIA